MSPTSQAILCAEYFDRLCIKGEANLSVDIGDAALLAGSMFNPLAALRHSLMNFETQDDYPEPYSVAEVAKALNCPEAWLCDWHLITEMPFDDVLKLIGKAFIVFLSCWRNNALANEAIPGIFERSLDAVKVFEDVLRLNGDLARTCPCSHG